MTSATERLHALLDERGKAHRVWPSGLVVWHDEGSWVYEYSPAKAEGDYWGGILHATLRHCDPEQAVEATLGRGTCHRNWRKDGYAFCSECGYNITGPWAHWCPNCGRKVEQ